LFVLGTLTPCLVLIAQDFVPWLSKLSKQLNLKDSHFFRFFLRGRAGGAKSAVHENRSRDSYFRYEPDSSECRGLSHCACLGGEIFPVVASVSDAVAP
jgi:hypothetical protein